MLKVDNLTVRLGPKPLLDNLGFTLDCGQSLVVMGETGAGKSLCALALMGALPPPLEATGTITFLGERLDHLPPKKRQALWGTGMTLLPQEPWRALDPLMISRSQVNETYQLVARQSPVQARHSTDHDLATLGLEQAAHRRPGQLSGGMGQRVAFAATRAGGAGLIIADEPTKGLDHRRAAVIIDLLKQTQTTGGALIVITHDISVARSIGGQLVILKDGRAVERGPTELVLDEPQHPYTRELIAADPSSWPVPTAADSSSRSPTDPSPRPSCDTSSSVTRSPDVSPEPSPAALPKEPVLEVRNLAVGRGRQVLVDGINLTVRRNERIAITGPSGIGKTTILDTLAGLVPKLGGTIDLSDHVHPCGIQKIYQDPPAAFARLVSLERDLCDVAKLHNRDFADICQLLDRLRVDLQLLKRRPDQVSGGELQRVAIARALAVRPAILLADEPTSRLDPVTQKTTIDLLGEIIATTDTAVILVTHDTTLAQHWATAVLEL